VTETKTKEEEKAAEQPKPATKHKLPEGIITPVEATHRLKKEGLAPESLNSQLVYTKLKGAKTNKMPVRHYNAEGEAFDEPQVSEHGIVLTRPGFEWDELAEWWANQPARGSKPKEDKEEDAEAKHRKPEVEADESDEDQDDELDEDDEDLGEAE